MEIRGTPAAMAALLAALSHPALAGDAPPPAAGTRPNIVFIISDDHGWTDYGFLGHPEVRTPGLDRLAAGSLLFPRGYVPSSLCCPSLASIITGLYPHQHRITSNDPPVPPGMAPAEFYRSEAYRQGRERMNRHLDAVATLPRILAARGYRSFQAGKWWQGDFRRGGFTDGMTRGDRHGDDGLAIGRKSMAPVFDFMDRCRHEGAPFFLWYAPMLPHQPHDPPERLLARYRDRTPSVHQARYWAMVEWFDETCGALLDRLDRGGLAGSTIVFYLADNGWIQDPRGPRSIRSKLTPHDGGIRTPLMIRWPGKVAPGRRDEPVLSIDIVPTVLALLGLPARTELPGIDILDAEAARRRPAVFGECFGHNFVDIDDPETSLLHRWEVEGRWKLIVHRDPASPPELYDILADPGETRDLSGERPGMVAEMRWKMDRWWYPGT